LEPLNQQLQSLADIRRDLKSISSDIVNLESKLIRDITMIAADNDKSQKNYAELQASVKRLSAEKINKETLDLEIFKLKKNFQNTIFQAIDGINEKLDAIERKIGEIQISARSSKRSMKSISKKDLPSRTTVVKSRSEKEKLPSQSGSIDEQDLPE
jgi:hypothetical protein